jgi:hypothetical protein
MQWNAAFLRCGYQLRERVRGETNNVLKNPSCACLVADACFFGILPFGAAALDNLSRVEIFVGVPVVNRQGAGGGGIGAQGALTVNFTRWLGLAADGAAYGGELYAEKGLTTLAGGPVFWGASPPGWFGPYAHALFGAAHSGCGAL